MVHVNAPASSHSRRRLYAAALLMVILPSIAGAYYFGYHTGGLTLTVTDDALPQFSTLYITFSQVQVHSNGALTASDWVTIPLAATTIDLTRLADNVTQVVGAGKVQAGAYDQVRIVVDSAQGQLKNGQHVEVTVPSGELKASGEFSVRAQGAVNVLVRLLVVEAGGTYILRPVFGGALEP
jgi:hypothetical protein